MFRNNVILSLLYSLKLYNYVTITIQHYNIILETDLKTISVSMFRNNLILSLLYILKFYKTQQYNITISSMCLRVGIKCAICLDTNNLARTL